MAVELSDLNAYDLCWVTAHLLFLLTPPPLCIPPSEHCRCRACPRVLPSNVASPSVDGECNLLRHCSDFTSTTPVSDPSPPAGAAQQPPATHLASTNRRLTEVLIPNGSPLVLNPPANVTDRVRYLRWSASSQSSSSPSASSILNIGRRMSNREEARATLYVL